MMPSPTTKSSGCGRGRCRAPRVGNDRRTSIVGEPCSLLGQAITPMRGVHILSVKDA